MNDKSPMDFIRQLLASMRTKGIEVEEYQIKPDGSLERVDRVPKRTESLRKIHEGVDMDLIAALEQWFESQTLTEGTVRSTLAFMLSHELYHACDDEDQACRVSNVYGDYIHQTVHLLYQQYGPPPKKNTDVEK